MRKFAKILCRIVQLLSIMLIVWATVEQINLQIEKFGFLFVGGRVFIPHISAWGYLGIPLFMVAGFINAIIED